MALLLFGILESDNLYKYWLGIRDKLVRHSSSLEAISVVLLRLIRHVDFGTLVLENVWQF